MAIKKAGDLPPACWLKLKLRNNVDVSLSGCLRGWEQDCAVLERLIRDGQSHIIGNRQIGFGVGLAVKGQGRHRAEWLVRLKSGLNDACATQSIMVEQMVPNWSTSGGWVIEPVTVAPSVDCPSDPR